MIENELDVLRDASRRLDATGVPYMVTGSMAMNYYAQPRMTRDIDVVIEIGIRDASKLFAAFSPDYYISPDAIIDAVARNSMFNVVHQGTIIKVDLIPRKLTEYAPVAFGRRRRVTMKDFETWVAAKEDLILSKLDWAKESESEQQFRDIRNLVQSGCDVEYVDAWAQRLRITSLWQRFRP